LKAVILAGGQGLRLRPLTEDKPKPLVPVNGRPIAEFQIEHLKTIPSIDSVTFLCGYKWEKLREYFGDSYQGLRIEYSIEETPLGTGGAIKRALSKLGSINEDVIIMNGDVLTDVPFKNMVDAHNSLSTKCTVTMLLVPYKSRFGIVYIDKLKMIRKFEEKPVFPDVWINGGIYIINAQKVMKHLPEVGDIERETFPKLVTYGEISAFPYYGFWSIIDSIKDLQETENQLKVIRSNV
jgi:NDP-sugar pyrophosphorylase family protein